MNRCGSVVGRAEDRGSRFRDPTRSRPGAEVASSRGGEVLALLPHVQPGCVLVSWSGGDLDDLRSLRSLCHERNLHTSLREP